MQKPKCYTLEIQAALTTIREHTGVNMFFTSNFLTIEFGLSDVDADECLLYWIDTYEPKEET